MPLGAAVILLLCTRCHEALMPPASLFTPEEFRALWLDWLRSRIPCACRLKPQQLELVR